jgi:hypothetical protein
MKLWKAITKKKLEITIMNIIKKINKIYYYIYKGLETFKSYENVSSVFNL